MSTDYCTSEYTVVLTIDNIYAHNPVEAANIAREQMIDCLAAGTDPVFDVYEGELLPGAGDGHTQVHADTDDATRTGTCDCREVA